MSEPFLIFPWNRPFLPMLKERLDTHKDSVPLIISPTSRPWQYLKALYLRDGRPRLLPRILTLKEVEATWFAKLSPGTVRMATTLDAVALLRDAVRKATDGNGGNGDSDGTERADEDPLPLHTMDLSHFYPWGTRLADLIDEMLAQRVLPEDIAGTEGEVMRQAVALLDRLGKIREDYLAALDSHGLVTRGLMSYRVASHLEDCPGCDIPLPFRPTGSTPVYVVGFHTLTRTQEALLRRLWEAGAYFCLHTDPLVAGDDGSGRPVHWICQRHADWIRDWHAETVLIDDGTPADTGPDVSFRPAYDLHSQMGELVKDLRGRSREDTAAIVLPSPTMLMPVLHNLPEEERGNVNVTVGCPLSVSSAHQLLMDILALHAQRDDNSSEGRNRFYWRRLLACFENPLLTGLGAKGDAGAVEDEATFRALRLYCRALRNGLRFVDPDSDVLSQALFDDMEAEKAIIRSMLACFIGGFRDIRTTAGLAHAITSLCDFLRERMPKAVRERSPLDMEALYRMENTIAPQLAGNLLSGEDLELPTLMSVVDSMFRRENLFFEPSGEQLTALQVTGVIESTLLHYDHVYVLEATDDRIPGKKRHDPLLPDSLRAVIGLPDLNQGDQELGYAVHRLCANARTVRFYWQEGVVRTHIFDGKKTRSRFVEEFIWRREQADGHIIQADAPDSPLRVIGCNLTPLAPGRRGFPMVSGSSAHAAMEKVLCDQMLSPSFLDDYLCCPALFAFKRLAGLGELEEVNEGDDYAGVGTFIHDVLETFHREYLGQAMPGVKDRGAMRQRMLEILEEKINDGFCLLAETLPPDSLAILKAAARSKLPNYLMNQPEGTVPLLLEHTVTADIGALGRTFHLQGKFDRLDQRQDGLILLDYKTGEIRHKTISQNFWDDQDFFDRLAAVTGESCVDDATRKELDRLMDTLRAHTESIQLPAYITIASAPGGPAILGGTEGTWPAGDIFDAAFVALKDTGCEVPLYKPARSKKTSSPADLAAIAEKKARALTLCPGLVRLVIMHMATAREFGQRRGKACRYCEFARLCQS